MTTQTIVRSLILLLLALVAGLLGFLLYDSLTHNGAYMQTDEVEEIVEEIDQEEELEDEEETFELNEVVYPEESFISVDSSLIGITFGNGTGMQIVDDAIVTLHSERTVLYATRHVMVDDELVQESVALYEAGGWVTPAALSESENSLIAMFITRDGFHAVFSFDGGITWSDAQWVGDTPVGASVPTSCLWHEDDVLHAMLAWVAPEHQGDGGPLYVAEYVDGAWEVEQVSALPYVSSPSLACDAEQQSMIIRSEQSIEKTGDIDVYFLKREDGAWTEPAYVIRGADPHLAVCDGDYWVGYHDVGANRLYSDDEGETWETEVLSKTGKFGAVACDGDVVAISWGQWPSLKDANSKAPTRGVGAQVSFDGGETWEEWKPAGDEIGQQISMMDVRDGVIAIFWRTEEGLMLKTYTK
jgi:hypothetical protein